MYDCPPDDIDCMDRLMRALTEELRRDMLHNQRRGSGGGGTPDNPNTIIDELTDSCTKSILSNMRSRANMKSFLKEHPKLKSQRLNLSEVIIDLFEKSRRVDLVFKNGTTENNANASTSSDGRIITFNEDYLKTATQLAIPPTMIHAYLINVQRGREGFKDDEDFYTRLHSYYKKMEKDIIMIFIGCITN